MLYRMMMLLENQMAELEVYNQIFAKITRPVAPSPSDDPAVVPPSEPLTSAVCPSLPLCDLLDRIRKLIPRIHGSVGHELAREVERSVWDRAEILSRQLELEHHRFVQLNTKPPIGMFPAFANVGDEEIPF